MKLKDKVPSSNPDGSILFCVNYLPLCDLSFFLTIEPAEDRFRRQPVKLVKIFGSARTASLVSVGNATCMIICLSASHEDNVHRTAELKSRSG